MLGSSICVHARLSLCQVNISKYFSALTFSKILSDVRLSSLLTSLGMLGAHRKVVAVTGLSIDK